MSEHWRRDEPQLFNMYELPWERLDGPRIAHGVEARLLTRDVRSGSSTFMLRLQPGWRLAEQTDEATLECFVLQGDLAVEGRAVGAGGFLAIPKGCGPVELASTSGAELVLFWNPVFDTDFHYDSTIHVKKIWQEPWSVSVMPDVRNGVMHKSLRVPDPTGGALHGGPNGILRLQMLWPGFGEPKQEIHHDVWEEIIFLSGDFLMPERGWCGPGTVLSHPPSLPHGPLMTQRGCLLLGQTDKPVGIEWKAFPAGAELTEHYLDTAPYVEHPSSERWLDRSEYRAWLGFVGGDEAGRT